MRLWILAGLWCGPALGAASDYLGAAACAACHPQQYEQQAGSRHAQALRPARETALAGWLMDRPLRERSGVSFDYRLTDAGLEVTARKDGQAVSAVLEWAFGGGSLGVTPVGRYRGRYFEHRVSYYAAAGQAALTFGHPSMPSPSAEAALGLVQKADDIYRCFNCHATGVRRGAGEPDLTRMHPGVECERCHGPGSEHVAAARVPGGKARAILNPGRLPAPAIVQTCGECHRTPPPGQASPTPEIADPVSVRFQPIGLMASRCFAASRSLSCLTCHDPHTDAVRGDDGHYTAKCLGCHSGAARVRKDCKRAAKQNCLPCHMRQTEPAPHLKFTDHRIRVYSLASQQPGRADFAPIEKLIASGAYQEALAELERSAVRSDRWHSLASKVFDGLNDPARAVEEAQAALDLEPRNESYHLQLAQIFLDRNTPQPAFEILSEAQALFPGSLLVRLGKGLALKELQRYAEAENELSECLRRNPKLGLAFDALATVYLHSKRYQDAQRAAQRFVVDNPGDFRGYYYMAAGRDGLKLETAETERLLERAIALRPDFAASHALLGKVRLDAGRPADAVPALEEAIRLRPDYSPAHYHLGGAYRQLGRSQDAERALGTFSELKEKERQPAPALRYRRGKK